MRGASDNPFRFEIAYARPASVASIDLVLGYMPSYGIAVTVIETIAAPAPSPYFRKNGQISGRAPGDQILPVILNR